MESQVGFRLTGETSGAHAGIYVGRVGDVNGDSFGDFAVAAPYQGSGGRLYVVYGGHSDAWGASPAASLSLFLGGTLGTAFDGVGADALLNVAFGAAGDVNGDRIGDFLVGTAVYSQIASTGGAAFIVFGRNGSLGGGPVPLNPDGVAIAIVAGNQISQLGWSISGGGDVNGDGIADFVAGAPDENQYAGAAYIVFGRGGPWPAVTQVSSLSNHTGVALLGEPESRCGSAVSIADVNNDGLADVIVGASRASSTAGVSHTGRAYVVFGRSAWPSAIDLGSMPGSDGVVLDGEATGDSFGASANAVGDVNGDDIADVVVGAPYSKASFGRSYLLFGRQSWPATIDMRTAEFSNGVVKFDGDSTTYSGFSVSGLNDINHDGFSDLVIGGFLWSGQKGRAYVVFGHGGEWGSSASLSSLMDGSTGFSVSGSSSIENLGIGVSGAGDVNGDEVQDILVGANGWSSTTGQAVVITRPDLYISSTGSSIGAIVGGVIGGVFVLGAAATLAALAWRHVKNRRKARRNTERPNDAGTSLGSPAASNARAVPPEFPTPSAPTLPTLLRSQRFGSHTTESIGSKGSLKLEAGVSFALPTSCKGSLIAAGPVLSHCIPQLERILEQCETIAEAISSSPAARDLIKSCGLNHDEVFALVMYTFDLGGNAPQEQNFYFQINEILRKKERDQLDAVTPYLTFALSALRKLPNFEGTVYRGNKSSDVVGREYKTGREIFWSGFTSTTTSLNVAMQFAGESGVIFKIKVNSGKAISAFSAVNSENEVLLHPNSCLIVSEAIHADPSAAGALCVELVEMAGEFHW